MKKNSRFAYWMLLLLVMVMPMACDEKESDLGVDLQDPSTRYDGIKGSTEVTAYTVFDDSLRTSGIASTIIGRNTSSTYGQAEAIYYTQIGLTSEEGINFDDRCHIDSIVLNLRIERFHPFTTDSSMHYDLHFEIQQLANKLIDTASYYSDTAFSVNGNVLYDGLQTYSERDTLLRFKLRENSYPLFKSAANQTEFQDRLNGLRIKLKDHSGDDAMVVINLAAVSSKVTMYYKYGDDPNQLMYDFNCGQKIGHYTQFKHNYVGTALQNIERDTMKDSPYLYITPMGGTNVYVRMDDFIKEFHQAHPSAVIHYAELIMPVKDTMDGGTPDKLYAYRSSSTGYYAPIADLLDPEFSAGFEGTYLKDKNCYRMRISRHVQQLLRTQKDYGTLIVLNSRRSSALSVEINKPIRIDYIYTEIAE